MKVVREGEGGEFLVEGAGREMSSRQAALTKDGERTCLSWCSGGMRIQQVTAELDRGMHACCPRRSTHMP